MGNIRTLIAALVVLPAGVGLLSQEASALPDAVDVLVGSAPGRLEVGTSSGTRTVLTVHRSQDLAVITRSQGVPLRAGAGCRGDADVVTCAGVGSAITDAWVHVGAGSDDVRFDVPGIGSAVLDGGAGNDTLTVISATSTQFDGGLGNDTVQGGPADDHLLAGNQGNGADSFRGGPGRDSVNYGGRTVGVDVSSNGLADDGEQGEKDNVATDVEVLAGGFGFDRLYGGAGNDTLFGDLGNDTLVGFGGNDELVGEDGNDTLFGGAGNDRADNRTWIGSGDSGDGDDTFHGEGGVDTVSYADRTIGGAVRVDLDGVADDGSISLREKDNQLGVENVVGTSLHDLLSGDVNANVLTGGPGQDALHGRGGNDSLRGDGGDDKLYGYEANDALIGGAGHDLLDGGVGNDSLDGGADNDQLLGGEGNDAMHGGPGPTTFSDDDVLNGGKGTDLASYSGRTRPVRIDADNAADDGLPGSERDNVGGSVENLAGGAVNDTLTGNAAPNLLLGLEGADTLGVKDGSVLKDTANGGPGSDTCTSDPRDARISCER